MMGRNGQVGFFGRERRRVAGAAVEFAVVFPTFLLFLWGVLEFGRLVMVEHAVQRAANEAARAAVTPEGTIQDALAAAESVLAANGISGAQITITPTNLADMEPGEEIQVEVTVQASQVRWLPFSVLGSDAPLVGRANMLKEGNIVFYEPPDDALNAVQPKDDNDSGSSNSSNGNSSGSNGSSKKKDKDKDKKNKKKGEKDKKKKSKKDGKDKDDDKDKKKSKKNKKKDKSKGHHKHDKKKELEKKAKDAAKKAKDKYGSKDKKTKKDSSKSGSDKDKLKKLLSQLKSKLKKAGKKKSGKSGSSGSSKKSGSKKTGGSQNGGAGGGVNVGDGSI